MKTFKFKTALALVCLQAVLQLTGCTDRFPSSYILELPKAPESWVSLLGEPCWRVEWVDPDGRKQMADIHSKSGSSQPGLEIELPVTWANPVIAWPYWPGHNLIPGLFKPAGALFPYDVDGNCLRLSWEAGVDAVFYWELIIAQHLKNLDAGQANEDNHSRIAANFNWPRFRELFEEETVNEAVREDPWLVNWRSVAERTVVGTFDRRRLVPEAAKAMTIPVPAGIWYGTSPFTKPLFIEAGEPSIFSVRPNANVWISAEGILRVSGDTWVFTAWD
jgi:hypothetical protein